MKKQTLRTGNYFNGKVQLRDNRLPGFTIVELLIVIVVIGILAAISIVAYNGIQIRAANASKLVEVKELMKKLELYRAEHGEFPDPDPSSGTYYSSVVKAPERSSLNSTYVTALDLFTDRTGIEIPPGTIYQRYNDMYYVLSIFPSVDGIPMENRSNRHVEGSNNAAFPNAPFGVSGNLDTCGGSISNLKGALTPSASSTNSYGGSQGPISFHDTNRLSAGGIRVYSLPSLGAQCRGLFFSGDRELTNGRASGLFVLEHRQ